MRALRDAVVIQEEEQKRWWHQESAPSELSGWLGRLRESRSRADLVTGVLEHLPDRFEVTRCGVMLWGPGASVEYESVGICGTFWQEWLQRWRKQDGVLRAVFAVHAATHNLLVYSERAWSSAPIYRDFIARFGIYYYLSAPVHGPTGALIGVINLYRASTDRSFDDRDLTSIGVRAAYLSAALARLEHATNARPVDLAPRELEVAKLAAKGFDNTQISEKLLIARDTVKKTLGRVYEKLQVNGRAQMAARLVRDGVLL